MKINKLSDNLTPLDEGIFFGIDTESDTPSEIVVEIIEATTGEVVAVQQLHNALSATINIAPYIARLSEFAPTQTLQTTFIEIPTAAYKIRVDEIESEEIVLSVNRCKIDSTPALITAFPSSRRIARGESDEVTFASEQGKTIIAELVGDTGETLILDYLPTTDISSLIISLEDFDSELRSLDVTLYCEEKAFSSLHYTVVPPLKNATRLAWLSECGTIEHYTFPVSHKVKHSTKKQSVMTSSGICSAHNQTKLTISLCSRLEPRAIVEALAEIISSPKVWIKRNGEYKLVEVATTEMEYSLFGEPNFLHLDICLWQKGVTLW